MSVYILLKSSAILAVYYLLYYIFLRQTTFIRLNRLVLNTGLLLSLAIPFVSIPAATQSILLLPELIPGDAVFFDHDSSSTTNIPIDNEQTISASQWIMIIYFSGVALMILRLISSLAVVISILRNGFKRIHFKRTVYVSDKSGFAFSFFNAIVIPEGAVSEEIVTHEEGHVKNYHWCDLILVELTAVLLWFNPVIYMYRNAIRQIHEYEADEWVVSRGVSVAEYLKAIVTHLASEQRRSFINGFSSQSIKARINMLTKNKTPMKRSFFYLLLLPAISMMLYAFAEKSPSHDSRDITIVIDPAHGGADAGATAPDGWSEKEFTLSLAMKVKELGAKRGIKVVMTRETDESVSLQQRIASTKANSSLAFVSLHAGGSQVANSEATIFIDKGNTRPQSEQFAGGVLQSLRDIKGLSVKDINYSSAYVLKNNNRPALILEIGNMSNSESVKFLKDADTQILIAERILDGVSHFAKK